MIEKLIEDINKSLDAEAYMSALALLLVLPDICAKAEYGDTLGNKERYIKWFDENIGQYEILPNELNGTKMPHLTGEVIYQLRCSMLHQGTPNIDSSKIKDETCKIDRFILIVEKKNPFDIYADSACIFPMIYPGQSGPVRSYGVNIRRLCLIITSSANKYYKENKNKFHFSYEILDKDEYIERINKLNEDFINSLFCNLDWK